MVTVAKDAVQQLYRSVFSTLNGDVDLRALLQSTPPEDPKIYQTFIDFASGLALKNDLWVTYGVITVSPMEVEQMQDVQQVLLDVHVWQRGPGSDTAELVEKQVRTLLDNADLNTENLFSWFCHFTGFTKTYESVNELWHIVTTYRIMCMAVTP